MDISVYNIKAFVCLAPKKHTATKTMRAPRVKRGQVLYRAKAPPEKRSALCGLLNVNLTAVDFASYRETGRLFLLIRRHSVCRLKNGRRLIYLSVWQCYIAKYP